MELDWELNLRTRKVLKQEKNIWTLVLPGVLVTLLGTRNVYAAEFRPCGSAFGAEIIGGSAQTNSASETRSSRDHQQKYIDDFFRAKNTGDAPELLLRRLRRYGELYGLRPLVYTEAGLLYRQLGDHKKAFDHFVVSFGLAMHSRRLDAIGAMNMLASALEIEDENQALTAADEVYTAFPDDQKILGRVTQVYLKFKQIDRALEVSQKMHEREPDGRIALILRIEALTMSGRYQASLKLIDRLEELYPSYPHHLGLRLEVLVRTNALEDAIRVADLILATDSKDIRAHAHKISALIYLGRIESAQKALESALSIHPGAPKIQLQSASLLRKKGRLDESGELLRKVSANHPNHRATQLALVQHLFLVGRFDEIDTVASKFQRDRPKNYALGLAALGRGDFRKAYELLKSAEQTAWTKWTLARSAFALGRFSDAYRHLLNLFENPGRKSLFVTAIALLEVESRGNLERSAVLSEYLNSLTETERKNLEARRVLFDWTDQTHQDIL